MNSPSGHFQAFSFVDRIVAVQPGVSVSGTYQIPSGIEEFPSSLVAEAIGQLAAWSAMAALDFKVRPVAGLAGKVEFLAPVVPGQMLELAAEIEAADLDAVAYSGQACVDGKPVMLLRDCVGPMMPLEEFDDPVALRERFAALCSGEVSVGEFDGIPEMVSDHTKGEFGRSVQAILQLPATAPFFADHFPRRPVFPGTLLLNLNLNLALALVAEISSPADCCWRLRSVSDVKLRGFIPPGEILHLEARLSKHADAAVCIVVETRKETKLLGGARVQFSLEALS